MSRLRMLGAGVGVALLLGACSSNRDAGPGERPTTRPSTTTAAPSTDSTDVASTTPDTSTDTAESTTSSPTASTAATTGGVVTVVAVAGSAGGVEASGPPFTSTDPFSEAARLSDGTCVGWADSKGGSTFGLAVGAPVTILAAEANEEVGTGTIGASRWVDVSNGGGQWNCFFDISATITGAPAEFRIKVGSLDPWTARPDPTAPGTFAVSVSTDASIGLIPSCPALPQSSSTDSTASTTTAIPTTTVAAPPVSGWNAVGTYWSQGVAALCTAGLPVTAIARPCRPPGFGSEYIVSVVDSSDPTIIYANGAPVPLGTELTVVVATGRPCG